MATKKMSILEEELRDKDLMDIISGGGSSKVFQKNTVADYSYPTGIAIFDYTFGYLVNVRNEKDEVIKQRTCLGLQAGSFNVATGRTQSFKTTIMCNIIANIAYANNGNVVHYDTEQRTVLERVKNLTKLPESWFTGDVPRYSLRTGAIGFDTLQNDIAEIYENKMKYRNILLKDTGEVDQRNNPIKLMPPTIVFLDSLQDVIKEEYNVNDKKWVEDSKELRGNMYGAQTAKTIRGFITDILPMLKEANIIMIVIAHKTSNMSTQMFAPPKKQFQYGSNDERISGGSAVEFNASAVINLTGQSSNDSLYHIETDGFEGNTVLFEPTKVSTNESGNAKTGLGFKIIVDKRKGSVDNVRTLVRFLEDRNRLKGNRAGWRVIDEKGEPISEKFTWKNIYQDFEKNPDTFRTFMQTAKNELETLLAPSDDVAGTIDPFNINKILNDLN